MKIYFYEKLGNPEALCERPAVDMERTFKVVKPIMEDVRLRGDSAVKFYTERFDGVGLEELAVSEEEILEACEQVDKEVKKAFIVAVENIEKFHKAQALREEPVETMKGVVCFRESRAIEKVGLYVPAGSAPLPSTVLMLGIPARIAEVSEVVLCAPPARDGKIAPEILYAARLCGISKIFKVGGAQAIAAMAYGTETVPRVYKIFGPGNQFVTAAKILASSFTAIDMPAGPSEVLVIADGKADCRYVAADLLSQAEHGVDSQVVLACLSLDLAEKVLVEIEEQIEKLPRREICRQALEKSFVLVCGSLQQAFDFSNEYAPEHLILNLEDAERYVPKVINAGSVFLGKYSCESAGDYASGTNHVLPTFGFAKSTSGASVDSFIKKITFQKLSENGAKNLGPIVSIMASTESLGGHKKAMELRYQINNKL